MNATAGTGTLRCSFCNKAQRDVRKLIAGPSVHICDECVDICLGILADERTDDRPSEQLQPDLPGTAGDPATPLTLVVTTCALCHLSVPLEHALPVDGRGFLCPGCIGAAEAAIAASREVDPIVPESE